MTRKLEICIFLHAYQPPYPAQDPRVIERITRDCYNPFFQKLLEQEQKITLNINACLLDTLHSDSPKTIDLLKECARFFRGVYLITASGATFLSEFNISDLILHKASYLRKWQHR